MYYRVTKVGGRIRVDSGTIGDNMSFIMGDKGCWMIDHIAKTVYKPEGRESKKNTEQAREYVVLEKRSKGIKKASNMDMIETVCNLFI